MSLRPGHYPPQCTWYLHPRAKVGQWLSCHGRTSASLLWDIHRVIFLDVYRHTSRACGPLYVLDYLVRPRVCNTVATGHPLLPKLRQTSSLARRHWALIGSVPSPQWIYFDDELTSIHNDFTADGEKAQHLRARSENIVNEQPQQTQYTHSGLQLYYSNRVY